MEQEKVIYVKILNIENQSEGLEETGRTKGPIEDIQLMKTIKRMKNNEASGPSEVGEGGVRWAT